MELFKDMNNRDALAKLLIEAGFAKALVLVMHVSDRRFCCTCLMQGAFSRSVSRYMLNEKAKLTETKAGWYTPGAMASVLKMTPSCSHFL